MPKNKKNDLDVTRRVALKTAATTGAGIVVSGSIAGAAGNDETIATVERVEAKEQWFSQRAYSLSGNKVLVPKEGGSFPKTTLALQIYRPKAPQEIANIVKSYPATTPIACVCGGHESSNAAIFASSEAVVLDMKNLNSIEFTRDDEGLLVTVGAGVVFRELVEAVKNQRGALPVGTGPGVGVVGYIVNGGLSGYFTRRLGLLGQRVVKATMVTAAGEIRVLTAKDELLTAMMGAGSALGIITDVTIRVAPETVIQSTEQRVFSFKNREQATAFCRGALGIMRDDVLSTEGVSFELVVTGTKALVATLIFFDSFDGSKSDFVKPLEELAAGMELPQVAEFGWSSWYEAAAALWPVINEMKGAPLVTLQHCVGTRGIPEERILKFVSDTMVAEFPLDEAEMSIIEIRTLGGAALTKSKVPSGNCQHQFFIDLITMYDAKNKTLKERQEIAEAVRRVVEKAKTVKGLSVDFSGTHSQPDDPYTSVKSSLIFGTETTANMVKAMKKDLDPSNRFRFHPFTKLL
ncbi:FAD-binding protein [Pirellulaceae bacterium]|nr:FAD-binding protein [Pirellulaceae bacterium]